MLSAAATSDHGLDRLLHVEAVQAGLALGEVLADRVAAGRVDLVVEELIHPLQRPLAVVVPSNVRAGHELLPSRTSPRSRA